MKKKTIALVGLSCSLFVGVCFMIGLIRLILEEELLCSQKKK